MKNFHVDHFRVACSAYWEDGTWEEAGCFRQIRVQMFRIFRSQNGKHFCECKLCKALYQYTNFLECVKPVQRRRAFTFMIYIVR